MTQAMTHTTAQIMTPDWIDSALFYHIYPLGLLDAPAHNDFSAAPVPRLEGLAPWIDHILGLNLNAVYLGPVFESTAHGYDTADYFQVDRRLGTWDTLRGVIGAMKARGLRVILDGVFNHVGRGFWAFRDVQAHGQNSVYAGWFHALDFGRTSPYGDPFGYEGWAGHMDLVKLNTSHPGLRQHLFDAVSKWIADFDIDGLRLDAADVLDHDFLRALAAHCRAIKPEFWLMGEVVHGDYRTWANPTMLNATTNYELYKGLYSSHADRNYFEVAYSLNREFGAEGLYRDLRLYTFADNHDVNRVASNLSNPAHLYPLYLLLFTVPGVPSVYYGSEWGLDGARTRSSDAALRPALTLDAARSAPHPALADAIRRFAALRRDLPALRHGDYRQVHVDHEQFAFERYTADQSVIVAVNAVDRPVTLTLGRLPGTVLHDALNGGPAIPVHHGQATVILPPTWGAVWVAE
ncbi:MAG TPA: alpha-amylase family glycosyl hydrolase [Aggregatilinea sp.]|uniref:alpha-amylase family glycosyl hydrolase n=1 Tax=Aggregatilinea sp. TaxID=2806333 RepID=UPI002C74B4EB|nr:alpha-amylase family glycosyl hydrolase [Aggregatilinea sp.]HML24729.1 alpha-amylase family glycosyl hydrolase [Aggregatilinea sp.]